MRLGPARIALAAPVAVLLALVMLMAPAAPAFGVQRRVRRTVRPLPASSYSMRPACSKPPPGEDRCLALELVPESPQARAHARPLGRARIVPAQAGASGPCEPPTAAEDCYGLRPQDLHSAYSLPATAPTEQTVAIVDAYDDPKVEADLQVYDEEFGLPACTSENGCFTKVNEKGKASPLPWSESGWSVEISLDVETVHAICESCRIVLVEAQEPTSGDLDIAEETAVTRMGATEVSNSWSGPEPSTDSSVFDHPGVAIVAAAGDDGYLNWDTSKSWLKGHAGYPASSPHVVAVGGTRLRLSAEGKWTGESVWNGASTLKEGRGATGGGCSESFTAPVWQQELPDWSSVGCEEHRAVADVSADADPYTGVAIYDSVPLEYGSPPPGWLTIGGTSLSSPVIAATFALAGGPGGVQYPARTLYEGESIAPGSLHDVQDGSNGECGKPFEPDGLSGCTAAEEAASCAATAICLAGAGYDGPTGVGTPDGLGAFQKRSEPGRQTQQVEFTSTPPGSAAVGGPTYEASAVASSGLPVSLSSGTPTVCRLEGVIVSFVGAGTCTIDADQEGDSEYEPAPQAQQSFEVGKGTQTLEFTSSPPSSAAVAGPTYEVSADASSGLPASFSSATPGVCSVTATAVSFLSVGTCTIDASQEGSSDYEPAPEIQQSFEVGRGTQSIAFTSDPPSEARPGGPTYEVTASASSGLPVTFSPGTPAVCSVTGATVSFLGPGTCTVDADQEGDADYEAAAQTQQTFAVHRLAQSIEFASAAPTAAVVNGPAYAMTAIASSGLYVSFSSGTPEVCSVAGATASFLKAGTCTVDADQEGNAEYEPTAQIQQSFVVKRRSQSISFTSAAPTQAVVGGPAYGVAASASSGLAVAVFSGTPSVCTAGGKTISFVGAGTCKIEAEQEGDAEYAPATPQSQSFAVGKGSQTITFTSTPPSSATVGGVIYAASASSSSGLPVLLSSGTPGVCTMEEAMVTLLAVGRCTIDANQAGDSSYDPASQAQQSFAVAPEPKVASPPLLTASPGPSLQPTPDSAFKLLHRPSVRRRTGKVSFAASVKDPGTFSWLLTYRVRRRGAKRRSGHALATVVFGRGRISVARAGKVTFVVAPSAATRRMLKKRRAIQVKAALSFQSSLGGASVSHERSISVKLRRGGRRRRNAGKSTTRSSRRRSSSLQAQSAISSAIGAEDARFAPQAARLGYEMQGGGLQATLGRRGLSMSAGGQSTSLVLTGIGRGSDLRSVSAVAPRRGRGRIVFAYAAGVREWYAARPLGIEQGFSVARPPRRGSGPLTLALSLKGPLRAVRSGSHIDLVGASGATALRYGSLSARDARGRLLPASLSSSRGELLIEVRDAGARYPLRIDPLVQRGEKLPAPAEAGRWPYFGDSVALSADGQTAVVGAPGADSYAGRAWVFTRSGSTWVQQGEALVGGEESGTAEFGHSVAVSADGDTVLIGGRRDDGYVGAAWVFTRSGSSWVQQGPKLTGTPETGNAEFGASVALSADGGTALIGGPEDYGGTGSAWVFVREGATWVQQGPRLEANDESAREGSRFGCSVALSADGDTALIGGWGDETAAGAAWVFTRSGSSWTQQGAKLTGSGEEAEGGFGVSVALSADGSTALIGAPWDGRQSGAAWVFARSGSSWTQQGGKLRPPGEESELSVFGIELALSAHGDTALIGEYGGHGAVWVATRAGSIWTVQATAIRNPDVTSNEFGAAIALAPDGRTALIGSPNDGESPSGAVWTFVASPQIVAPSKLSFGDEVVGRSTPVKWLEVRDSEEAPTATLKFTGAARIVGADPSEFVIPEGDDLCQGATLEAGQACRIGVRFAPRAGKGGYATLAFGESNVLGAMPTVSLSGTGLTPPVASFDVAGGYATLGTPTLFDGEGSHSQVGYEIERYEWSFGDGTGGEGSTPEHTYSTAGTYTVRLTVTDRAGITGTVTQPVAVKQPQQIEFTSAAPQPARYHGHVYRVTAKASSGLPVTFSSQTPAVCAISGSSVSFVGLGECRVAAEQPGDAEYAAAPTATQELVVGENDQTVGFTSRPPARAEVGGPSYSVSATASSGLPVSFSTAAGSSACTLQGETVSFVKAGVCSLNAWQGGSGQDIAAANAQQSFVVAKRTQTIEFGSHPPADETVGGGPYVVAVRASSRLPVALSSATPTVCAVEAKSVSFASAGTCVIYAAQAGDAEYDAAPEAGISFPVRSPSPVATPNSGFKLIGAPQVDRRSGAIAFTAKVHDPGTFTWLLSFQDRVGGRHRRCPARRRRRCTASDVLFSVGNETVHSMGKVRFTAKPNAYATAVLESLGGRRARLHVTAVLSFQSSLGGAAVSRTLSIGVKGLKAGAAHGAVFRRPTGSRRDAERWASDLPGSMTCRGRARVESVRKRPGSCNCRSASIIFKGLLGLAASWSSTCCTKAS